MKKVTHKVETSIKVLLFLIAAGLFIIGSQYFSIKAVALEEDEKQFLQNNGFDPEQVKDVIKKIHKDRISDLAAVLKDQGDKLD